jgi:hypothetical protein
MNTPASPDAVTAHQHRRRRASFDLYWLPLGAGAGGWCVRGSGRVYEALTATRLDRKRLDLYHSALIVQVDDQTYAIEMAPVWAVGDPDRGVVSEGPVGAPSWGRLRFFRYEIRCWQDGTIPDAAAAVESPQRVSNDETSAHQLLGLVASCPVPTWGRDELCTGEMWNSNSVTSWLLQRSGHDAEQLAPPTGGRAPGWAAGVKVAVHSEGPAHH